MNFKIWLEAYHSQKEIMYHGTSDSVLAPILSQGLIPNPKQRTWQEDPDTGIYQQSRKSLDSIYLTKNLMTARLSAMRAVDELGGKNRIIVIVEVEPRSLLADEDDVNWLDNIPSPYPGHLANEYTIINLYANWKSLEDKTLPLDQISNVQSEIKDYEKAYVENQLRRIEQKLGVLHPSFEQRIRELLKQGFYLALERRAAYLKTYSHDQKIQDYVSKLHPAETEKKFLQYKDQMTRTLKRLARDDDSFSPTSRLNQPIGYSGKNKIVAIVKLIEKDNKTYVEPVMGKIPEDFVQQWEDRIGELRILK